MTFSVIVLTLSIQAEVQPMEKVDMKLRYQHNAFGPKVHCIDESEYDGAEDAGPQLVGQGDTQDEARRDFFELWLNREALRDMERGASASESWDKIMRQVVGLQS